ncbi:hypothetical protein BHE74_00034785 [Ensete ventricosum]|nr:hypothetical protein B296_00008864 [Ensete ventricosum]RWW33189.1 hypothetical protein GW17_00002106 [Ensete ventricosum]RWW58361.1 hypothetical protein BHE74_00034785 [Ensete ventricosum]RZR84486.1 hypothetical protein BHM03_00011337 [Ensete ventricosum]
MSLFVLVQALVYFILSNSSDVFSSTKTRSFSLRTARSGSLRCMLALFSDLPSDGEPSPRPSVLKDQ